MTPEHARQLQRTARRFERADHVLRHGGVDDDSDDRALERAAEYLAARREHQDAITNAERS